MNEKNLYKNESVEDLHYIQIASLSEDAVIFESQAENLYNRLQSLNAGDKIDMGGKTLMVKGKIYNLDNDCMSIIVD